MKDCVRIDYSSDFDKMKSYVEGGFIQMYYKILEIDVDSEYKLDWDSDCWKSVEEIMEMDDLGFIFDLDYCDDMVEVIDTIMDEYITPYLEDKWGLYGVLINRCEIWVKKPSWLVREDKIEMLGL